jgi:hypothetical protein
VRHLSRGWHVWGRGSRPGALRLDSARRLALPWPAWVFDDFCHAHDPGEDHDTGSFEASRTILFKIDHNERPLSPPSPEATGQMDRVRVITVMLAEEN